MDTSKSIIPSNSSLPDTLQIRSFACATFCQNISVSPLVIKIVFSKLPQNISCVPLRLRCNFIGEARMSFPTDTTLAGSPSSPKWISLHTTLNILPCLVIGVQSGITLFVTPSVLPYHSGLTKLISLMEGVDTVSFLFISSTLIAYFPKLVCGKLLKEKPKSSESTSKLACVTIWLSGNLVN